MGAKKSYKKARRPWKSDHWNEYHSRHKLRQIKHKAKQVKENFFEVLEENDAAHTIAANLMYED